MTRKKAVESWTSKATRSDPFQSARTSGLRRALASDPFQVRSISTSEKSGSQRRLAAMVSFICRWGLGLPRAVVLHREDLLSAEAPLRLRGASSVLGLVPKIEAPLGGHGDEMHTNRAKGARVAGTPGPQILHQPHPQLEDALIVAPDQGRRRDDRARFEIEHLVDLGIVDQQAALRIAFHRRRIARPAKYRPESTRLRAASISLLRGQTRG